MIEVVLTDPKADALRFDTDSVEVTQSGALVVYTHQARDFWAGFNAGEWRTFQRLDVRP